MLHKATQNKQSQAWRHKIESFTMLELEKGIKGLNRGKACDPEGLCLELFQTDVIGASLKESLLTMLNNIKHEGVIPEFMRESIITTIPKPGTKFDL